MHTTHTHTHTHTHMFSQQSVVCIQCKLCTAVTVVQPRFTHPCDWRNTEFLHRKCYTAVPFNTVQGNLQCRDIVSGHWYNAETISDKMSCLSLSVPSHNNVTLSAVNWEVPTPYAIYQGHCQHLTVFFKIWQYSTSSPMPNKPMRCRHFLFHPPPPSPSHHFFPACCIHIHLGNSSSQFGEQGTLSVNTLQQWR